MEDIYLFIYLELFLDQQVRGKWGILVVFPLEELSQEAGYLRPISWLYALPEQQQVSLKEEGTPVHALRRRPPRPPALVPT